jgi:hypothetical protein
MFGNPFFTIKKKSIVVDMCKWWNGTHVKNEFIHQNTMLKFHGQIFGIQFVMDFKNCTKTFVQSRIN